MFNTMDAEEKKKMWVIDKHISLQVTTAFAINAIAAALWIGWWGSSYSGQLARVQADVSELKTEQRQLQVNLSASGALADKRLSILEAAIPEIKDAQREMMSEIRRLNELLSQYIAQQTKRDRNAP